MFQSIFENGVNSTQIIILLLVSLIMGIIFTFICYFSYKESKNFLIASSLLPMTVCLIIILVNGNIGTGVAIAGAFSLVRFRSLAGNAKQICVIFILMASGLTFGMGYITYGILFLIICGLMILIMEKTNIWKQKINNLEKIIRITIPEDLDYTNCFLDIFEKYTNKYNLIKVRTTNMGSMFKLSYEIELKDIFLEKEMIDEIRVRNGNLEVCVERIEIIQNNDL